MVDVVRAQFQNMVQRIFNDRMHKNPEISYWIEAFHMKLSVTEGPE